MNSEYDETLRTLLCKALKIEQDPLDERIEAALDKCDIEPMSEDEAVRIAAIAIGSSREGQTSIIKTGDSQIGDQGASSYDDVSVRKHRYLRSEALPGGFEERRLRSMKEKEFIGAYIALFLSKEYCNQAVAIDGGSTNMAIGRALRRYIHAGQPTVRMIITNNVLLPELLCGRPGSPELFLTGGLYRASGKTLVGGDVVGVCRNFAFGSSVVGVNGLEFPEVFTTTGSENDVKTSLMQSARDIIFPIDASKMGTFSGRRLANIDELVAQGKRVSIVTAYPPEGKGDDRGKSLRYREALRLQLHLLEDIWRHGLTKRAVVVTLPPDAKGKPIVKPTDIEEDRLTAECLDTVYAQLNSQGRPDIGVIIVFELFKESINHALTNALGTKTKSSTLSSSDVNQPTIPGTESC